MGRFTKRAKQLKDLKHLATERSKAAAAVVANVADEAIVVEEKSEMDFDFDVDSPVVVIDDDTDWETFVEVEHVKLEWSKDAKLPGKSAYTGESSRSKRRGQKEQREFEKTSAFTNTPSIASMFPIAIDVPVHVSSAAAVAEEPVVSPAVSAENNYDTTTAPCGMTILQCLRKLENDHHGTESSNKDFNTCSNYDHLRYHAIKRYYLYLQEGLGKMQSSTLACLAITSTPRDYLSRCIRLWAEVYMLTGLLPLKFQGCHIKHDSLVYHEDHAATCRAVFRGIKRNQRTAELFALRLKEANPILDISVSTAVNWLHILGFACGVMKKHIYVDGHEREDVVAHRKVTLFVFRHNDFQCKFESKYIMPPRGFMVT